MTRTHYIISSGHKPSGSKAMAAFKIVLERCGEASVRNGSCPLSFEEMRVLSRADYTVDLDLFGDSLTKAVKRMNLECGKRRWLDLQ
jgi:hypothetical protein